MSRNMNGEIVGLQQEIGSLISDIKQRDRNQALKIDGQVDYEKCDISSRNAYMRSGNSDMEKLDTLKAEMDRLLEYFLQYTQVPDNLQGQVAPKFDEASQMATAIMDDIEAHYPDWESDASDEFSKVKHRQMMAVKELVSVTKSSSDLVKNVGDVQHSIFIGVKATLSNCRNQLREACAQRGVEGLGYAYLFVRSQSAVRPLEDANSWLKAERDGRSWAGTANELSGQMDQIDSSPNILVSRGGWPVKTDGSAAHAADISAESATARMETNTETCYYKDGTFVSYIAK